MEILVEISKARCLQMVVPGLYLNSDVLNYDKLPWTIPALVLITVNILHPKHWKSVKGQSKLKFSMEVAKWKISFPPFESDGSILKSLFFFLSLLLSWRCCGTSWLERLFFFLKLITKQFSGATTKTKPNWCYGLAFNFFLLTCSTSFENDFAAASFGPCGSAGTELFIL